MRPDHLLVPAFLLLFAACARPPAPGHGDEGRDTPAMNTGTGMVGSMQRATLQLTAGLESRYHLRESTGTFHTLLKVQAVTDTTDRERLPLNLAVVVDRSGSMADAGKLDFVKQAVELIIDNLAPEDRLSLVAYDSEVQVVRSAEDGELDREALKRRVWALAPGSSTNLSGGLLEGFAQAARNKAPRFVNRVLLLSDGLANQGITDVNELEALVKLKFGELGIALSTFGVGAEYNEDLMTALAEHGRGNYWFIDRADRIPGMFAQEMDGLLRVVAQNATVTVAYASDSLDVVDVWGHSYRMEKGRLIVELNDVVSGAERNILVAFRPRHPFRAPATLSCRLSYDDVLRTRQRVMEEDRLALLPTDDPQLVAEGQDPEVVRRKVQLVANRNLEEAMREADKGNFKDAEALVSANGAFMSTSFSLYAADSAQQDLYDLNAGYLRKLDSLKGLGETERKLVQKGAKSGAYRNRKGR